MMQVLLGITKRCNCNCGFCIVRDRKQLHEATELTTQEFKAAIDQVRELHDPDNTIVVFIGGEPLVRRDCAELVQYAHASGYLTHMDTNGTLMTEETVKTLKDAGLNGASITLDTDVAEEYDRIKKMKGGYERARNGLRFCVDSGLHSIMATRFTKKSIYSGSLDRLIQFAINTGVDRVALFEPIVEIEQDPAEADGSINDIPKLGHELEPDDMVALRRVLAPYDHLQDGKMPAYNFLHFENRYQYDEASGRYVGYCQCFRKSQFSISWFGDIMPCIGNVMSFGNIREKPLKQILDFMWNHDVFQFDGENAFEMANTKHGIKALPGCYAKYENDLLRRVAALSDQYRRTDCFPKRLA